jgi:hypothetical protein
MTGLILSLAVFLLGLILAAFAIIVVSIRRDDRAKTLTHHPHSSVQATTRRLLGVGVRKPQSEGEER